MVSRAPRVPREGRARGSHPEPGGIQGPGSLGFVVRRCHPPPTACSTLPILSYQTEAQTSEGTC